MGGEGGLEYFWVGLFILGIFVLGLTSGSRELDVQVLVLTGNS